MKSRIKGRLLQCIVVFVSLSLLLQPVQQAFAADDAQTTTPDATTDPSADAPPDAGTITGPVLAGDQDADPKLDEDQDQKDTPTNEQEPKDDEQTDEDVTPEDVPEPPVNPTPQLPPSTVKQKLPDADIASGALVYNYQLQVPSGRAGVQPDLALSYNSQQNEEGSIAGFGWQMNIPTIERKNVDGLNKIYAEQNFTSSLGGDLKKIGSSSGVDSFGAKIDNGSYLQYAFDSTNNTWTVKDKTGTTYTFGATAESRLSDPTDATKVFRWHLTRVQDAKGNFVLYEYAKVDNQVYPSAVYYTGNGSNQGIFKVQFNLEDRPDKAMSAKYGFMVTNSKRIAEVDLLVNNVTTGKYNLSYGQQAVNDRSELRGVAYTGYDSSGVNPVTDGGMSFEYSSIAATDLLSKITQNTGGTTTITYESSAQYVDNSGALLNPHLPFAVQTVQNIAYDDRNGTTWHNLFEYAGGYFYYNGPMDRRFVGFEKVVRTDDSGNTMSSFYHQGNGNNTAYGETADDWAKAGKAYKTELRDAQGNLFSQVLNTWDFERLAGIAGSDDRSFVNLATTVTRTYDGNSSHKDQAASYSYDTDTGNLTSGIDWGEVTGADNGTFTDVGNDKITSNVTYAAPTTDLTMVGIVSGFTDLNQAGAKVKEQKISFDSLTFGQVSVGNPTKEENWISGLNYATTTRTFNNYGLPLTETDPNNHTTTFAYDSFNLYPATITNALSQAVSFEYDYRIGKPFKTTDANGLVDKITFDGLGRPVKDELTKPGQTDPNVLFTKQAMAYELYSQSGEVRGWKTTQTNYLDDVNATTSRENKSVTYTDGFDRVIQTRSLVESADGSSDPRYSITDTAYNGLAQIAKISLPYFSIGDDRTAISTDANLFATLTYDALYRVTATANAVGTSTNVYDDWQVITTDVDGKVKDLRKDAFDRLIEVKEHNGTDTYTTSYTYDAEGDLTKIVDALNNERNFGYDGLGRRTHAEDLHASGDSTFGVWGYAYDPAGNLLTRTDANSIIVIYGYDALNRITSETVGKGSPPPSATYTYDSCVYGIGRLCTTSNSAMTTANEYNTIGQLTKETKTINGQAYIIEYAYDRQGNQLNIKNPDNSEVKYAYNIGGAIESIQSKESSAASFGDVVVNMDYGPTGAVTYQANANGTVTTNMYDPAQLYRLTDKVSTRPDGAGYQTIQNLSYVYDAVGNITEINDLSDLNTRKIVDYTYDDLHRLTNAHTIHAADGQNYTQTYQYDAIGNITYKSDTGTYSYDGDQGSSYANPHAVTAIDNTSVVMNYTYDKNGNMLTSPEDNFTWDYNNRMIKAVPGGILARTINYGYDASGMRVSMTTSGVTTAYPSKFYNTDGTGGGIGASGAQKHIFAGDNLAATIAGSGTGAALTLLATDHLGSTNVVTDAAGALAETLDYYPFGSIRHDAPVGGGAGDQRKYTGLEYDVDTGMNYMGARYYMPSIGRFTSEDPLFITAGFDLSDPQSMNSYAYARNNPIRMVDPDGQWFMDMVKTVANVAWGGVQEVAHQAVGLASLAYSFHQDPVGTTAAIGKSLYNTGKTTIASAKALATSPQARSEAVQGTRIATNDFLNQSLAAQANQTGRFLGAAGIMFFVGPEEGVGSEAAGLGVESSFMKAGEHVLLDHPTRYPGLSADGISNLARDTYDNAFIKGRIQGTDPLTGLPVNKQYYGGNGRVFVNTDAGGPPTVFDNANPSEYIRRAMTSDLKRYGTRK